MGDSKQSKKAKASLDEMDKILQDKIATIGSEADRLNEHNANANLSIKNRDESTEFDSSESLDDLLRFDAHVLTSSSSEATADSDVKELAEKLVNQQIESSLDAGSEYGVNSEFVEEVELTNDEFAKSDTETVMPCLDKRDNNINSTEIIAQNKRILSLEVELLDLKKLLEVQTEVNMGLEETDYNLRKMNILSLVIGICALIMSVLLVFLNVSELLEVEQQELIQNVSSHSATPVIDPDIQKIDDLQINTNAIEVGSISSTKTLILPEDDIFEIITVVDAKELTENTKVPVKEWVVNLSSYQQRSETDKKIKELEQKGISAEVIIVNVGGKKWFRIRVVGFKTISEAESYVIKIKKTLNEDLAWVSRR